MAQSPTVSSLSWQSPGPVRPNKPFLLSCCWGWGFQSAACRLQGAGETSGARAGDGKQLNKRVQCGTCPALPCPSFRSSSFLLSPLLSDRQLWYAILISDTQRRLGASQLLAKRKPQPLNKREFASHITMFRLAATRDLPIPRTVGYSQSSLQRRGAMYKLQVFDADARTHNCTKPGKPCRDREQRPLHALQARVVVCVVMARTCSTRARCRRGAASCRCRPSAWARSP